MKDNNIHAGHRKNLRKEFLTNGFAGKTDHQKLELLLTYVIPRRDVNPIAHKLIDEFGSLSEVIDASVEDLIKIDYITENAAVLIKLIPLIADSYNVSKWGEKPDLSTSNKLITYIKSKFIGQKNEVLYIISLDSKCRLININSVTSAAKNYAEVSLKEIASIVLKSQAKFVALVHNHPSGVINPSADDIMVTEKIKNVLKPIEVTLIDHIIISGENTFCFSQNGLI